MTGRKNGRTFVSPYSDKEFFERIEHMKQVKTELTKKEIEAAGVPYARINAWWQSRAFPAGRHLETVNRLLKEKVDAKARLEVP